MKNGNKTCWLLLLFSIIYSCSSRKSHVLIPLEEFRLKNNRVDSICRDAISQIRKDSANDVFVFELISLNNTKCYSLSSQEKDKLMDSYIWWNNRRIVGYTKLDGYLTIILSNVDNHVDFLDIFADDLELRDNTIELPFMYISKTRYKWETFDGEKLDWNNKRQIYEPVFFIIKQDTNNVYKTMWTNIRP